MQRRSIKYVKSLEIAVAFARIIRAILDHSSARNQRFARMARWRQRLSASGTLIVDLKNRFGSRDYAAEELVAELGAAFLSAEFGFDGDVRNAGYIATWIELLKADIGQRVD